MSQVKALTRYGLLHDAVDNLVLDDDAFNTVYVATYGSDTPANGRGSATMPFRTWAAAAAFLVPAVDVGDPNISGGRIVALDYWDAPSFEPTLQLPAGWWVLQGMAGFGDTGCPQIKWAPRASHAGVNRLQLVNCYNYSNDAHAATWVEVPGDEDPTAFEIILANGAYTDVKAEGPIEPAFSPQGGRVECLNSSGIGTVDAPDCWLEVQNASSVYGAVNVYYASFRDSFLNDNVTVGQHVEFVDCLFFGAKVITGAGVGSNCNVTYASNFALKAAGWSHASCTPQFCEDQVLF